MNREALVERMAFRPPGKVLHTLDQILVFVDAVLDRQPAGVLVECGAYRGVGTARLSHIAEALDTELHVFDSFAGLPEHNEQHRRSIHGRKVRDWFPPGALASPLAVAQGTVAEYGIPDRVRWHQGWFADTLPRFAEPVAGAYLDVDLAASTRTCLDYLWPLLTLHGVVVSQDGHLPLVAAEIRRWDAQASPPPAGIEGLGERQMVTILR